MKKLYNLAIGLVMIAMLAGCAGAATPTTGNTASEAAPAPALESTSAPVVENTIAVTTAALSSGKQQKIAISGAFALYPLVVKWADEYQKLHPEVRIDISGGGAGKGMADTLAGAVDIGMVSREVTDEEKQQGAYPVAVTRDAVFCTVSAQNPYLAELQQRGITQETLAGIFLTGEITTWGQVLDKPAITDEIHVYTRSDSAGAAEMWAKYIGGSKQDDLKGIGVNGDPGVLEAVIKDPLGIGYNNLNYAYDLKSNAPVAGAAVLPLDKNANQQVDADEEISTEKQAVDSVATGKYPSPPARPLYLVTKEKPTGAVADFIHWALTDGQQYITEAGYVSLTADELAASQAKIK